MIGFSSAMVRTVAAVMLMAIAGSAAAQKAYPNKPIQLVVPYPPGGSGDAIVRPIADKISAAMGVPILVVNRGGANGIIASQQVAASPPDGYTLELSYNAGPHASVLFFFKDVPYHPVKDFTAIIAAVEVPIGVVVHPSLPVHTMAELIDYARKNPGKLSYGSPGIGSAHQMAIEMLMQATGIKLVHVPYRGGGPVITDLLGGQIPMALLTMPGLIPNVKAGKFRALAVIEPQRYPGLPDVPTVAETVPGFVMPATWAGFFGPAGLPKPIVDRLNSEIRKALASPDVKARLEAMGLVVTGNTPEEFADMVKRDIEVYRKITAAARIQPE